MDKIGFKLIKVNTHQFASIEDSFDDMNEEFNLDTGIGFAINPKESNIMSKIKVIFEQEESPFLILEASCEFNIEQKAWDKFTHKKKIIIPKNFLSHLAMITVGTARGILHSKTENTIFNDFILPTINVSEMITNDGEFNN